MSRWNVVGGGTASVTAISGGFQLAWQSNYLDGHFLPTGPVKWTLDIVPAVPIPVSVSRLGSGLVGFIFTARSQIKQ